VYWLRGNFFEGNKNSPGNSLNIGKDKINICSYEFTDKNALTDINSIFTITKVERSDIGKGFNNLYECKCTQSISESDFKDNKYGIVI
jgi:hypothetical protein